MKTLMIEDNTKSPGVQSNVENFGVKVLLYKTPFMLHSYARLSQLSPFFWGRKASNKPTFIHSILHIDVVAQLVPQYNCFLYKNAQKQ